MTCVCVILLMLLLKNKFATSLESVSDRLIENYAICAQESSYYCLCTFINSETAYLMTLKVDCSNEDINKIDHQFVIPEYTEILDLSGNKIKGILKNSSLISNTLKELFLNRNGIKFIEVNAFERLSNLEVLDLSENFIETIDAGIFHGITKLQMLNLAFNKLKRLNHQVFFYLPKLRLLDLSNNDLGDFFMNITDVFDLDELSINNNLEILKLRSINISWLPEHFFHSAYNLKHIVLAENPLTTLPQLPSTVEYLDISSTLMSSFENISDLSKVETLIANHLIRLTILPNNVFMNKKNLKHLFLEDCKQLTMFNPYAFGDDIYESSKREFDLKTLSLIGCSLQTLDENLCAVFSNLSVLNLHGNPWNCDCKFKWITKCKLNVKNRDLVRCSEPENMQNHELLSLKEKDLICSSQNILRWLITNGIILCSIIITVITVWLIFLLPKMKAVKPTLTGEETPYVTIDLDLDRADET